MFVSRFARCAVFLSVSALCATIPAQAYCGLRDPVRGIHKIFPEAEAYRSIVRTIDGSVRDAVAEELPFTLHFNELGRHTLYVATINSKPIGLVHVRSEQGAWGMVEVAWAMDLDLRVINFALQRCRSRQRSAIESDEFKQQLIGRSFADLQAFLTVDGSELREDAIEVVPKARALARTVVRSGLKAISTTRHGWTSEVDLLKLLNHAYTAFPDGENVEQVSNVYVPEVDRAVTRAVGQPLGEGLDREGALLLRVRDGDRELVGCALRLALHSMGREMRLWWNIGPDLSIKAVIPEGGWADRETELSFRDVIGMSLRDVSDCATTAQLVGAEALAVVRHHAEGAAVAPPK